MIKNYTLLFCLLSTLTFNAAFGQGSNPAQYPYVQGFDSLAPFQFIEGQAGWLNGDFFGVNTSTVSVYPNRGLTGTQSMTMLLNDNAPTDSIITPLIGSIHAGAFISFYYRIVDVNGQLVSLTGNAGFKVQMKQDIGTDWILIDSISASNHVESNNYAKVVQTLPIDSINVNFRLSFYQGNPGQELYIDMDSLVVNDSAQVITSLQTMPAAEISVFNNEANQITIRANQAVNTSGIINIFDINGKLIYNEILKSNNTIDAAQWSKGVYFIQVLEQNKQCNKKIIVR